ncbi:MAG: BrnT family toxin [Bacteroidetes bacterium]|nr:BrnT family toxin [Bacteroidota bacterium]
MKFNNSDFDNITGFEWDEGNINKSKTKHDLDWWTIEEIFFNEPLLICEDLKHSQEECRYYALGKTDNNTKLFVVFTLRNKKIRVISARKMNKKERTYYGKFKKKYLNLKMKQKNLNFGVNQILLKSAPFSR